VYFNGVHPQCGDGMPGPHPSDGAESSYRAWPEKYFRAYLTVYKQEILKASVLSLFPHAVGYCIAR
jgi:hypothetical protein